MNTYTSNSTLFCHWCKIPLGNASQVIYLNGNLPICDLCLSKQVTPKRTEYDDEVDRIKILIQDEGAIDEKENNG